jgi:thioredoxin reductase (NADPH)
VTDEPITTPVDAADPHYPRFEQTFPVLSPDEIARMRRFGTVETFAAGDWLYRAGEPGPGMFVILRGHVAITQRDGLGHIVPVVEQGPGQFTAEIGSLSNRAVIVDGQAETEVEALHIPPDQLRALLVAQAELGEKIMRALILRRVGLIQMGASGPVLIGDPDSPGMIRLRGFLTRNTYPHHLLDAVTDPDGRELVARYAPSPQELPLVVTPLGAVLKNPSEAELAHALDMTGDAGMRDLYDVAIVGAGPAGLATAVYGASEGLSIVVIDTRAYGGQAGASARIENYLGFPTGISGQALAGRAYSQAQKFGAEMLIPAEALSLDCSRKDGQPLRLDLTCGQAIRARAMVVATGAQYRRPNIARLSEFEGRGVWYWASPIEARLCQNQEVVLVGGGNSAGQAAVYLSGQARKVTMMVRAEGLAASMSRYLIDRIANQPNIELLTSTEIIALDGDDHGLTTVRWKNSKTGTETEGEIGNVFLFVGADPATGWLEGCGVDTDKGGFVVTGGNPASPLESAVCGVFAVGDVRSGSVKRVGGAIGEGAQVVAAIHGYLAELDEDKSAP